MKKQILISIAMLAMATSAVAQTKLPSGYKELIPGKWMKDGQFRFTFDNDDAKAIEVYTSNVAKTHTLAYTEYVGYEEERDYGYKQKYSYDIVEALGTLEGVEGQYEVFSKLYELGYYDYRHELTLDDGTMLFSNYGSRDYGYYAFNGVTQNIIAYSDAIYVKPDFTYGKCRFYQTEYRVYNGEWLLNGSFFSRDIVDIPLIDQDEVGHDIDDVYASQTFFNDDEELEFVRSKFEKFDEYSDGYLEDDTYIPEEYIPHLATKEEIADGQGPWCHEVGYRVTGFEVVNTSGKVLYTLDIPAEYTGKSSVWFDKFIKNDGKIFAIVEVETNNQYFNLLYNLGSSASPVLAVRSNPKDSKHMFNLQGQRVNDDAKGIMIKNGRKFLKK